MYGLPTRYAAVIRAIKEGYTFLQDVAAVEYEESMYRQVRYAANVAGVGFDAAVIESLQRMRNKGCKGKSSYLRALIKTFFRYKPTGTKIWVDGRLMYNNLMLSMAIGVGKYNGGGIQQLPEAVADDGLLDITIIRPLHWWNIIFRLKRLFNGNIYAIGHVLHAKGKHIRVESSPELPLEVDGELYGHSPIEIRNVHREVRVIVNRSFLKKLKE
jgi:diacylglycerol kinase family enzyme